MAKVSLSQAAKDTGVSLPTLSRWRKSGRISAEKTKSGGYLVDTSEYDRIKTLRSESPNMKGNDTPFMKPIATPSESPNDIENVHLKERLREKDQIISELRDDRDDWKKQAQTLLLQSSSLSQPKSEPQKKAESSSYKFTYSLLITAGILAISIISYNYLDQYMSTQRVTTAPTQQKEADRFTPIPNNFLFNSNSK